MWYVCDVLYAVLYVCVCCFLVCGCAVSRRYIDVCYCDMFSVVYVYLYHLKLCVLMVEGMSVVVNVMLLLFAFHSMFISIWVSRLKIAEFPDSIRRSAP